MRIVNKNYNINNKLNKKIILISDIHYKNKNDIKLLNNILESIKKINPDYICMPGDILDKSIINNEFVIIKWFKELSKISKVLISIGNHEYYKNKRKKIFELNISFLNKLSNIENIYILDNENIIIDNINFIGINLDIKCYDEVNDYNKYYDYLNNLKLNKKNYNILLCHTPLNICDGNLLNTKNIDLVLCGHTHGGIVPTFLRSLFKNRGFITPKRKILPNNIYGNIKIKNTNIVITSGIKVLQNKVLSILFNPEIVIIKI